MVFHLQYKEPHRLNNRQADGKWFGQSLVVIVEVALRVSINQMPYQPRLPRSHVLEKQVQTAVPPEGTLFQPRHTEGLPQAHFRPDAFE